jgi:alpha-L-fucosidase 2
MWMRLPLSPWFCSFCLFVLPSLAQRDLSAQIDEPALTTAWKSGHFVVDTAGLVGRSDIVLGHPNSEPAEAMPLGNGRLGVAVWAANGFTAQLNRGDTLPHRDSPGQVIIPGLTALTTAQDFSGRLDLFDGSLVEHGGGMTMKAYVQVSTDTLVVEVTGADPKKIQTATLQLWEPRKPGVTATGSVGMLAQAWSDQYGPGAAGEKFGALAAITAKARDVSVAVSGAQSVTVSFLPDADGHFQVVVACPHYNGAPSQLAGLHRALANTDAKEHSDWWRSLWDRTGLIKITSADGSGEYMENLRNLYLYTAAAESGGRFPGSQAGIADLFSAVQDLHRWDPAAFWHWNLRMQVAANLDAGVSAWNAPYFRLYRENLTHLREWTTEHMGARPGICVPETMRFNGAGFEYEPDWNTSKPPVIGMNCDAASPPYYNARTISTGAEVSLWIWQQYLATHDGGFLQENYPVMAASARFLLAYQTLGDDGMAHTRPSNAHEQEWDTVDPVTDLSARRSLYPAVMEAANLLHTDRDLVQQLEKQRSLVPSLPKSDAAQPVVMASYDAAAKQHNEENLGLEPVWPYGLIGDDSPMLGVARHTYATRPYPVHQDWSFDPVQAARLGLPEEVRSTLIALTEKYQTYINGFANWGGPAGEFYVEQEGVVALALAEALVQDYDGLIRIAPAVPQQWDCEGTVWVRDRTRVSVQVRGGLPTTVVITAGATSTLRIRNPWPGQMVEAVDGRGKITAMSGAGGENAVLMVPIRTGEAYLLQPVSATKRTVPFASISGEAPQRMKSLGKVQIGK